MDPVKVMQAILDTATDGADAVAKLKEQGFELKPTSGAPAGGEGEEAPMGEKPPAGGGFSSFADVAKNIF